MYGHQSTRSSRRRANGIAALAGLAEEDRLVIDQYESAFLNHDEVVTAARANDNIDDFIKVVFEPVFLDTVITQMNANEKVFKLILADDKMRVLFGDYIAQKVYDEIREPSDAR